MPSMEPMRMSEIIKSNDCCLSRANATSPLRAGVTS